MDGLEWKSIFRIIKMDDLGGKPTIFGNIHIYAFLLVDIYWVQKSSFNTGG